MNTKTPLPQNEVGKNAAPASSTWTFNPHTTHSDPLLDCLALVCKIHGQSWTVEALGAGFAKVDNLLPPSSLARAAQRAGLVCRLVHKRLENIDPRTLPVILLLKNRGACILHERLANGQYRISHGETGESVFEVSERDLVANYSGIVALIRPQFRFDARTPQIGRVHARHWFWGVVFSNWRLYRDALLAALLLNLFSLAVPFFSMQVYDRVVPNHAVETLWVLALGALLTLGFDFILRSIRAYIIDTAGKRIDVTLSAQIMERVLGIQLAAKPVSVGSFAANLRAFESVRDFIASATVTTLIDLPFVLLFVLVLGWISPWLMLPPVLAIAITLFVTFISQAKMHELTESSHRASAQRNATLIESLVGLEAVKTLSAEGIMQRKWERATVFLAQTGARLKLLSACTINFTQFMQQATTIIVVIVGVYLLADKQISMGAIIASAMLAGRALAPLGQVAGLLMQYHNARTGLSAVESQMELPIERPSDAPFVHRAHFDGEIEFKNVSFSYPGRQQDVLKNVSFKIKAGEKVAFIGRIGSGKTTLEKLILGLYKPTSGAVFIDGIDSRQIDPAELRRAMGYVPQDVTLFYGSLRENILMGTRFADDNAMLNASRLAGVDTFAHAHPRGYDMEIGERGESLSGGQRQAVAIARALLQDPPVLLLDEPSSSMDHQSEESLKRNLAEFAQHKTLLLITHRTSLLELVDRLIVIDQGVVVADGAKAQVVEALQHGRVGRAA